MLQFAAIRVRYPRHEILTRIVPRAKESAHEIKRVAVIYPLELKPN